MKTTVLFLPPGLQVRLDDVEADAAVGAEDLVLDPLLAEAGDQPELGEAFQVGFHSRPIAELAETGGEVGDNAALVVAAISVVERGERNAATRHCSEPRVHQAIKQRMVAIEHHAQDEPVDDPGRDHPGCPQIDFPHRLQSKLLQFRQDRAHGRLNLAEP